MEKITYTSYEHIIESLNKCMKDYYVRYANEKIFTLYLANGESIYYSIPENRISHLLGVDTTYLLSTSCLTPTNNSAMSVLEELCKDENVYSMYQKIDRGIISFDKLFSEHIQKKILAFSDNIQPNAYNLQFVCKIDQNICHLNGLDSMNAEYLICSKSNNDDYLLLGITKNDNGTGYIPITNQLFSSFEELQEKISKYVENQSLTFISRITIKNKQNYDNYRNDIALKPLEKVEKTNGLREYSKKLNCKVEVDTDYCYVLKQNHQNFENICVVTDHIIEGGTISSDEVSCLPYLGKHIIRLIDAYNNALNNPKGTNCTTDYSELQKQNESLLEELRQLKEQLEVLRTTNIQLEDEKVELIAECNGYKEVFATFEKGYQKIKTTSKK